MKKNIFILIIGIFIGSIITVSATILYNAKDIEFNPSDESWNVNNMQDAVNDIKDNYIPKSELLGKVWEFNYTGEEQTFSVPFTGTYKIELWGAQGGSKNETTAFGGKGAYTSGESFLEFGKKLYVYVGQQQNDTWSSTRSWNGGGLRYNTLNSDYKAFSDTYVGYGGGATDIRIISGTWDNSDSLRSRVMVAAGGGGSGYFPQASPNTGCVLFTAESGGLPGAAGGGLNGYDAPYYVYNEDFLSTGGTQISGGVSSLTTTYYNAGFGYGGQSETGGGSGWYGGGGARHCFPGASGGSSYISGHTGCIGVTSKTSSSPKSGCTEGTSDNNCSLSPYGIIFTNTKMIDGNGYDWTNKRGSQIGMPTHDGASTMIGNTGNGYAKITLISID